MLSSVSPLCLCEWLFLLAVVKAVKPRAQAGCSCMIATCSFLLPVAERVPVRLGCACGRASTATYYCLTLSVCTQYSLTYHCRIIDVRLYRCTVICSISAYVMHMCATVLVSVTVTVVSAYTAVRYSSNISTAAATLLRLLYGLRAACPRRRPD